MKKIVVTGAFGVVGRRVVEYLISAGKQVICFDRYSWRNNFWAKNLQRGFPKAIQIVWGDITSYSSVHSLVRECDGVIHMAAVIPPVADRDPQGAAAVNVGGTKNIVNALKSKQKAVPIVFTSSVAVYGDRLSKPDILLKDPPRPNPGDAYAYQKLQAEAIIEESNLPAVLLRLSYIVSPTELRFSPLLFDMPLNTSIELCHVEDAAAGIAKALITPAAWGRLFHIAGGARCRTSFRVYLNKMMEIMGFGTVRMPERVFHRQGFHCGFMQTASSQALLHYQQRSCMDIYAQARTRYRMRRLLLLPLRPFLPVALRLFSCYGRVEAGEKIVTWFQRKITTVARYFPRFSVQRR